MTLMPTGKVLVVGGLKNVEDYFHMADIAALFDPATGKFSRGPKQARTAHGAVQLLNGKVLISGG